MNTNNGVYLNAAANLKSMVREAIDCDFASNMSFDELTRQLTLVAREVEALGGFEFSNIERLQQMQVLAEELKYPTLAQAA